MPTYDEVIAIHEAGHAIADVFYGLTFEKVMLDPPQIVGELYRKLEDRARPTAEEMDWIRRQAKSTYAAQWAEREQFGIEHVPGSKGDNENVIAFCADYLPEGEDHKPWMSEQLYAAADDVKELMTPIRALASALMISRSMTYDEVLVIYEKAKNP